MNAAATGSSTRMTLQVLGRRGSRRVVDASAVPKALDPATGQEVFPIRPVFDDPQAVFIGFGRPNVYTVVPRPADHPKGPGWDKFAAFMFWRKKSFVANTKGRVQAGVQFELLGLPIAAVDAMARAMTARTGRRSISCAHANALMLADAGFTAGGRTLTRVVRPSKLASRIWDRGLEFEATVVELRVVQTGATINDHFVTVWNKEVTSLFRSVRKKFTRDQPSEPAPVFAETTFAEPDAGQVGPTTAKMIVSVSKPSFVGAHLAFLFGEHPVFEAKMPVEIEAPALATTLKPFPGKLSPTTRLKKYLLFSRPVIWFTRRHLISEMDRYYGIPGSSAVTMLRPSPGPERSTAFVYNFVLTGRRLLLCRLENDNGRDRPKINWLLSKHLMMSGYSPNVRFAGEAWCYWIDGRLEAVVNNNSGSYKPEPARLRAAAALFTQVFGIQVHTVDAAGSE